MGDSAQPWTLQGAGGSLSELLASPPMRPGSYYRSPGAQTTTGVLANNTLYLVPFLLKGNVDRVVFEVITTAGEAGSTCNPLIYRDDGHGYPGSVLYDGGPVNVAGLGIKGDSGALDPVLGLAGLYWCGLYAANAPTTRPQCRGLSAVCHSFLPCQTEAACAQANNVGLSIVAGGGVVPNPAPAGMVATTIAPLICVRAA